MTMDRRTFLGGMVSAGGLLALGPDRLFSPAAAGTPSGTLLDWGDAGSGAYTMVDFATGGNTLVLVSEGHALVVDTKSPLHGAAIRGDTEVLGGNASVSLLNTHHHGDHTAGNAAFADVPSYAHTNAKPRIEAQLERYKRGGESADGSGTPLEGLAPMIRQAAPTWTAGAFTPKRLIGNEGRTLKIGARDVQVSHFGIGHTDNDLVVKVPSLNVVHTGDLVFSGLHSFYDPAGGVNARGWASVLERVYELCDRETVVIPGHGKVGDRSAIKSEIEYHSRLIEAVQAEIDKGTSKENAQEMSWAFMEGLEFGSIRARAIGAVYDELTGG